MSGPFILRVWRIGFARAGYSVGAIGGWRRLWWRLWWDLREPMPEAITVERPPLEIYPSAEIPLHWSSDASGMPFCGEALTAKIRWTREYGFATCPNCRKQAWGYILKYRTNSR